MPLEIVFLEPQNWRPLKPHYSSPKNRLHGSHGASQRRPCVRIGLTRAYSSHVKMTLANAKSVNRQTLENAVRNAASEFTRRTAIASLASLP